MGFVGGFFSTLDLKTNTSNFEKGGKALADVGKKAVGLKGDFKSMAQDIIGMTVKMGAAFLGLGAALSKLGLSTAVKLTDLKVGGALAGGMNPAKFKLWTDAASIAGASAEGFAQSLTTLNDALQDLKAGDASKLESMSKAWALAFNNSNFKQILDMSPEDRIMKIMQDIEGAKDRQQAYNVLNSAGLGGLADADRQARARNTSILKQYNFAQGSNMVTGSDIDRGGRVDLLKNQVGNQIGNFFDKVGSEVNKELEKGLAALSKWLSDNKKGLEDFAKALGDLTGKIIDFAGKIGKILFGDKDKPLQPSVSDVLSNSGTGSRQIEALVTKSSKNLTDLDIKFMMADMASKTDAGALSGMFPGINTTGVSNSPIPQLYQFVKTLNEQQSRYASTLVGVSQDKTKGNNTFILQYGDYKQSLSLNANQAQSLLKEIADTVPGISSPVFQNILLQAQGSTR